MHNTKSIIIILTVISLGVAPNRVCPAQEAKKHPLPPAVKKDDEVIALRLARLQVEAETVGTVRKGDKLVVEDIQGDWFWVRSGQTRGWTKSTSVISTALAAWYETDIAAISYDHLRAHVDERGWAGAKALGVTYEVLSTKLGSHPGTLVAKAGNGIAFEGMGVAIDRLDRIAPAHVEDRQVFVHGDCVLVHYGSLQILVESVADGGRSLFINFDPAANPVRSDARPFVGGDGWTKGRHYGTVEQGDHVLITQSREVFVNGSIRQAR